MLCLPLENNTVPIGSSRYKPVFLSLSFTFQACVFMYILCVCACVCIYVSLCKRTSETQRVCKWRERTTLSTRTHAHTHTLICTVSVLGECDGKWSVKWRVRDVRTFLPQGTSTADWQAVKIDQDGQNQTFNLHLGVSVNNLLFHPVQCIIVDDNRHCIRDTSWHPDKRDECFKFSLPYLTKSDKFHVFHDVQQLSTCNINFLFVWHGFVLFYPNCIHPATSFSVDIEFAVAVTS